MRAFVFVVVFAATGSFPGFAIAGQGDSVTSAEATIYSNAADDVYIVTVNPCGLYPIDTMNLPLDDSLFQMGRRHQDVLVSLDPSSKDDSGLTEDWKITDIQARSHGPHDARALCTTTAPGAAFTGTLTGYGMGHIMGHVALRLSTGREVQLTFHAGVNPSFMGTPLPSCEDAEVGCEPWPSSLLIGTSVVRVNMMTRIDPNGELSDYAATIELVK